MCQNDMCQNDMCQNDMCQNDMCQNDTCRIYSEQLFLLWYVKYGNGMNFFDSCRQ